jgi:cytochrome P450
MDMTPTSPPARLLSGHARDLAADRLGAMTRWAREYGDFVPLRFGPMRGVLLSHPDLIEQVLVTQHHNFIRPLILRTSRVTFGDSMFVTSGERHLRQRRLAQPAFHRRHIAAYGEQMVDLTERALNGWAHLERRDIHDDMMRLTLAVVGKTLLDADVEGDARVVGEAMTVVMETFMARLDRSLPLPDTWPTPTNRRARKAVRRLDAVINSVIEHARATGDDGHLLGLLLGAEEAGDRLVDREVRDEVMAFFLAGHETTALWLTWTLYLLARHPDVTERLEGELEDVLDGRPPTTEDLPQLAYTSQVLKESLRLYPPAYAFARQAVADTDVGGHRITRKATVIVSPWVVHRDRRFWDRADAFDPDRWEPDPLKALPKFAYFPFGGGPHRCIGAGFATVEATLVLARIAQRFRLETVPGLVLEPLPQISLRPRSGLPMIVHEKTRKARPVTMAGRSVAT